jgi:PHP family Zn ribbon phosphoesterase
MHRVEDLADRKKPRPPPTAGTVTSLVPLAEVLGECLGRGPATKTVTRAYEALLEDLGPELHVLTDAPLEDVERASGALVAEAIARLRRGEVIREPGYDGEYGTIRLLQR